MRAHYRSIGKLCRQVASAFEEIGKEASLRDDAARIERLNDELGADFPWRYVTRSDRGLRRIYVDSWPEIGRVANEAIALTERLARHAGTAEHERNVLQFQDNVTLRHLAWLLELDRRHESEVGDHMVDADLVTRRILALIGIERDHRFDGEYERNMILDRLRIEELDGISKKKRKQYARLAAQAMLDNDSGEYALQGRITAEHEISDPKSPIACIKITWMYGTISSEIQHRDGHGGLRAITSDHILLEGDIPISTVIGKRASDVIGHPLLEDLDIDIIAVEKDAGSGLTVLRHDATTTRSMTGLFVVAKDHKEDMHGT